MLRWLRMSFSTSRQSSDRFFREADDDELVLALQNLVHAPHGFRFSTDRGNLRYWYHTYYPVKFTTGRMSLEDREGRTVWQRNVAHLDLVVFPFVKNGFVLYVGGYTPTTKFLIRSVEDGRLEESFAPEFGSLSPGGSPPGKYVPFYRDGYIYLEGTDECVREHRPAVSGGAERKVPRRLVYLLRVDF